MWRRLLLPEGLLFATRSVGGLLRLNALGGAPMAFCQADAKGVNISLTFESATGSRALRWAWSR